MLTGNFETADGVIHMEAVGICYPLVLQTYPIESARAGFDFNVWHDDNARQTGKAPIIQRAFSVSGVDLMAFISSTQQLVLTGTNLVDAAVVQMESVVLANEDFSGWSAFIPSV
jgi:hypothetical protein